MKSTNRTAMLLTGSMFTLARHSSRIVLGLLVAMLLSTSVIAQSITGSVSGIVTDSNGAAIPGATVTLVGNQKNDTRNSSTSDSGRFNFAAVQPGVYTIKIGRAHV